ncbi:sulfatase [Paenibacillus sp. 1P07SE]|uniref:sulfatase n=1 Tax=Paenibacillus sp. 1P07SE TaxID=3132209 RepID=UPI0039A659AC
MKAIMIMFDSLNRHLLSSYGCDWTHTPQFRRLAERSAQFDNCYAGSLPCMPARRELHTGRYNFLHGSWGPLEPYDESMPEKLKEHGIYTHLVTDHYHYWEDGGATYHNRYASWEIVRGQEFDHWKAPADEADVPEHLNAPDMRINWANRLQMPDEDRHSQKLTFELGLDFIRSQAGKDDWFVQIETFDPHEPFFSSEKYKALYPHSYDGPLFDWPPYGRTEGHSPEQIEHIRYEYAALLSMCDAYLGQVLDTMDELGLWEDTMLIVNTDHGFLLGEHGWWAKTKMPYYNEMVRLPLYIWDPRSGAAGVRRDSLVQTIDLAPTLLDWFGVAIPDTMTGRPLRDTIARDTPVREAALFGIFGGQINCTDGRYVYMRAPSTADNKPLYEYTLMPTGHGTDRAFTSLDMLRTAELSGPLSFTKGCRLLKMDAVPRPVQAATLPTALYDTAADPQQRRPIDDPAAERRMMQLMKTLMAASDAPPEQYERMGL